MAVEPGEEKKKWGGVGGVGVCVWGGWWWWGQEGWCINSFGAQLHSNRCHLAEV